MNLSTLLDNCADLEQKTLDFNPKIKAGFDAIELLEKMQTFILNPKNSIGFNDQFQEEINSILAKVPVDLAVS